MKYFKESEFFCQCGCGRDFNYMDENVVRNLDRARAVSGIPFVLTSSIRCLSHNKKVGGSKNSSHLSGYAVDIKCTMAYYRFKIVEALLDVGFSRIGIGKDFIHADQDPDKPKELIWGY